MTHLNVSHLNGQPGRQVRKFLAPASSFSLSDFGDVDPSPMDENDLGLDPKGLSPNYAPWWTQIPLKPGQVTTQRGTPTPGEARAADSEYWASSPLTPSNDARDLPNSYTGKPLRQHKAENYPGSYPHTWIPYEKMQAATGPEMGPTPPGWAPIPTASAVQASAENGGQPLPWVAEDQMTHDVSGFGSLQEMGGFRIGKRRIGKLTPDQIHTIVLNRTARHIHAAITGMGQIDPNAGIVTSDDQLFSDSTPTPASSAAASVPYVNAPAAQVTNTAVQAQAQGATPDQTNAIINAGAAAIKTGLQLAGKLPATKPATPFSAAAATPFIIGGLAIAAAIAAYFAMKTK
jgi:hypothetical protein